MDFNALLKKKVSQASNSRAGKFLFSLSRKAGGVRRLALLNMLCTASLGFAISFPIYSLGGMAAAFPTAFFTFLLVLFIFAGILSPRFRLLRKISPKLLVFAIIFSLPFGLLSLPLLKQLSSQK